MVTSARGRKCKRLKLFIVSTVSSADDNQLSGPIPSGFGLLTKLTGLSLGKSVVQTSVGIYLIVASEDISDKKLFRLFGFQITIS